MFARRAFAARCKTARCMPEDDEKGGSSDLGRINASATVVAMTTPSSQPPASSTGDPPSRTVTGTEAIQKPWRAEGLPPRQPEKPRSL